VKKVIILILLTLYFFTGAVIADDDDDEERERGHSKGFSYQPLNPETIAIINENYKVNVRPIFEKKCFVCHVRNPDYPWYSKVPGLGMIMKHHNREGVEDLDLTDDFPFKSKEGLSEALEELQEEVLDENEMPPWYYLVTHWDAGLTQDEQSSIQKWLNETVSLMKSRY
jgi:hypothetical protein